MGGLDDDMAMGGGCCTPVRDDNVLMALWCIDHGYQSYGQEDLDAVDHMPIKAPHHLLDDYSQGLRGPTHGYLSCVLIDI